MHLFWLWIFVTAAWQILRYALMVCDIGMLFAVKGFWLVAILIAAAAWYQIGWWVAVLVLLANFAFDWFVWFYMPARWLLRYEVNVQAFRFVDEMRNRTHTGVA